MTLGSGFSFGISIVSVSSKKTSSAVSATWSSSFSGESTNSSSGNSSVSSSISSVGSSPVISGGIWSSVISSVSCDFWSRFDRISLVKSPTWSVFSERSSWLSFMSIGSPAAACIDWPNSLVSAFVSCPDPSSIDPTSCSSASAIGSISCLNSLTAPRSFPSTSFILSANSLCKLIVAYLSTFTGFTEKSSASSRISGTIGASGNFFPS